MRYLSVFCTFQNEAKFLPEWIEYHKIVGVEHFYLYNHFSEDEYKLILSPYIASGEVTLVQWPFQKGYTVNGAAEGCNFGHYVHRHAINDCLFYHVQEETRWLAIIDADEFLVPVTCDNIPDLLRPYEHYGVVMAFWKIFGTSSVQTLDPSMPMVEQLTRCQSPDCQLTEPTWGSFHFKSIVQPRTVKFATDSHFCQLRAGKPVDILGNQFPASTAKNKARTFDVLRLNHYFYRDESWFLTTKCGRRPHLKEWLFSEHALAKYNSAEDRAIQRFVPQLKEKLKDKPVIPQNLLANLGSFDFKYYADTNPDLKEVYGYNEVLLREHFIEYGCYEGREPCAPV